MQDTITFFKKRKKNIIRVLLLATIQFLRIQTTSAQRELLTSDISSFQVQQYTNENGLPQNSVKDIAADSNGFIWLITEAGLVRFDGRNFKVWDKYKLGTNTSTFYRFHKSLSKSPHELMAIVGNDSFARIASGISFLDSSYSEKIRKWAPKRSDENHTYLASGLPNPSEHTLSPEQYIIPLSSSEQICAIINPDQIEYYHNWQKKSTVSVPKISIWQTFPIESLLFTRNARGQYFVINPSEKIVKKEVKIQGDILRDPNFKRSQSNAKLFWNAGSDQVFFYIGKRLYFVSRTSENNLNTELILSGFDFDVSEIIRVYFESKHQRVFLASPTRGLYVLSKRKFISILPDKEGISESAYAQIPFSKNSVLLATGMEVNLDAGSTSNPTKIHRHLAGLKLYERILFTARDKTIWARFNKTVYQFSPDSERLINSWIIPAEVEVIHQKPDGSIWLGTRQGKVYSIDPMSPNKTPQMIVSGLPCIRNIVENASGVWMSTDLGIYFIPPGSLVPKIINETSGLAVRSIHLSDNNEVWFTVIENGLYLYKAGKLVQFPLDEKKVLSTGHCIIEDNRGFFWIPTNNGLLQVQKADLRLFASGRVPSPYYHNYKVKDGFINNEFNGGCEPCSSGFLNGYVSIPSLRGLVVFKPDEVEPELPSNNIFIDNMTINGTDIHKVADTVNLNASTVLVEFNITSPYFSNDENLIFEYAITNNNKISLTWNRVNHDHKIVLTKIISGSQTLLIRKRTGFSNASQSIKSITILVAKPWHQTWLFRGGAILFLIAMFWLYGNIKSHRLKKENTALEKTVEKRTAINVQTMRALQESESQVARQIKIQTRLIASLTHDVQSPLRAVITISKGIEKLIVKGNTEQVVELSNIITDSTSRISTVMRDTLEYIKLGINGPSHSEEGFKLAELVSEKIELFSLVVEKQQNTIVNLIPVDFILKTNPYFLGIIISNLIDNANRYTKHGKITISSATENNQLVLEITDNGIGIPAHILDWTNSIIDSGKENESIAGVSGVGLLLIKEFVRIINGKIVAKNNEVGGSFTIFIPL